MKEVVGSIIAGLDKYIAENAIKIENVENATSSEVTKTLAFLSNFVKCYPFLLINDLWELLIDEKHESFSWDQLISLISNIVKADWWFIWLDYKKLEELIYSWNIEKHTEPVKIADWIKKNYKFLLEKLYKWEFIEKEWDLFLTFPNFNEEDLKTIKRFFWEETTYKKLW